MTHPESGNAPHPLRVLFVCSGNTCRSPMAELLLRNASEAPGAPALEVRSAGTHALDGAPASEGARRAARRHGHSLDTHASTRLTPELVAWADRILVMGPGHLHQVALMGGGDKASLLGAVARGESRTGRSDDVEGLSVPDPFGGDDEVYERTFLTLKAFIEAALARLVEEAAG